MDKYTLFKNIIYELSNKASTKTQFELRALYERLALTGRNKSGYAVESTYRTIDENITVYIEEMLKQISQNIKDYEILLNDNELEELFINIEKSACGLIESLMRTRKEYLDNNKLKDSRMDYKRLMMQNCSYKLNTEKQNLKAKILYIIEKNNRLGINITNNKGQINVAYNNAIINAKNNEDDK